MKNTLFGWVLLAALLCQACGTPVKKELTEKAPFFDLESLLEGQMAFAMAQQAQLLRTGTMDGTAQQDTLRPDSLLWGKQFALFKEADINKPALRSSYNQQTDTLLTGQVQLTYTPLPGESVVVSHLQVLTTAQGLPQKVSAEYTDANRLYTSKRRMVLSFEPNPNAPQGVQLASFELQGSQTMVLADSVGYGIEGRILY